MENSTIHSTINLRSTSKLPTKISSKDCEYFYGIDVSMEDFSVAQVVEAGKYKSNKFKNTEKGISSFIASLEHPRETLVTVEATGTYSMKLVFALTEAQIPTALLNPKQSKGFISGVMLSTTKTDDKDACGLALYGQVNRPRIYVLPEDNILEMKQLRGLLASYKKQKAATRNQLHALSFHPKPSDFVVKSLESDLENLATKIKGIESKICDLSEANFDKLYELTISIMGIGPTTAAALLTVTGGLVGFKNAKQLAKFLGVCPTQNESGKSIRGRGGIAKPGTKEIRALLYMCARSAKRYNLTCKDLYERLKRKGKCHKVAMTAVCHKLVKQFFAVVKNETPFDNEYQLKKNAQ